MSKKGLVKQIGKTMGLDSKTNAKIFETVASQVKEGKSMEEVVEKVKEQFGIKQDVDLSKIMPNAEVGAQGIRKSESKSIAIASGKLMVAQMNPFISREKYNQILGALIDSMSEGTLASVMPQIGDFLHLKKKDSAQYRNIATELLFIMNTFPRLTRHRGYVLEAVREHRKKCGLPVM